MSYRSRREFLRDLGLSAAMLPFVTGLPCLAATGRQLRKQRLVILFSPDGIIPNTFWPDAEGEAFAFKQTLSPLEPFKNKTLVLHGVSDRVRGDGDNHMRGMGCLLTGVELFPGNVQGGSDTPAGWSSGISIDQEIKNHLQASPETRTRFGSLEMGVMVPDHADTWTRMSYAGPNKPIAPIDDPYQMFGKLYGQLKDQEALKSVLDDLQSDIAKVKAHVGAADRKILDEHTALVRDMEQEIRSSRASDVGHAVPIYKEFFAIPALDVTQMTDLDSRLQDMPGPADLHEAAERIRKSSQRLALIDQAVKLPACQFQASRDPLDYLNRHTYPLEDVARLVDLRGSLAAATDDASAAVRSAIEVLAIARQINDDGLETSRMKSDRVIQSALNHLVTWAFQRPGDKTYVAAIRQAIASWSAPDLKKMLRAHLVTSLAAANAMLSPEGRKTLGLDSEGYDFSDSFLTSIHSQPRGRINIVRAERDFWKALEIPFAKRHKALEDADDLWSSAMDAFYDRGIPYSGSWSYDQDWLAKVQLYRAALRAVSGKKIPYSIPTADLPSPYDGKPLGYMFDGKRMVFTVSHTRTYAAPPILTIGPPK